MRRTALLIACLLALASTPGAAEDMRTLAGSVTYRERVTLPPGAELVVAVTAPDGTPLAETRGATGQAQVPLQFALQVPAGRDLDLQAALRVAGKPAWASDPVPVAAGTANLALPPILLTRFAAMAFSSRLRCGETEVELGFAERTARLRSGGRIIDLAQTETASGARYAAPDDPGTWVWIKGRDATLSLHGTTLPECHTLTAPAFFPLTARGTEPGWRLTVEQGWVRFTPQEGAPVEGPLPHPQTTPEGPQFTLAGGLRFALAQRLCHDSATGMPYPVRVTVTPGDQRLTGCGGDPKTLLAGTWQIATIAGAPVADPAKTMLDLSPGGAVAGRSGCNGFHGSYTLTGEGLHLGQMAATMMACPPPLMDQERRLFDALGRVDRFDIGADGTLQLIAADAPVITARPPAP